MFTIDSFGAYQSTILNQSNKGGTIASPFFILAVALLLFNDHYLKIVYPGALSGKLSDFAGLFALPFFLSIFLPKKKLAIYIICGAAFAYWKLSFADVAITGLNSILPFSIGRTIDYSDYIALSILPISYLYTPRRTFFNLTPISMTIAAISLFAFCATAGTHGKIKSYDYGVSKYQLQKYVDTLFKHHPEMEIPPNNTFYNRSTDPYFRCLLINGADSTVYTLHYYGGKEYWDQHPFNSRFSIVYVGAYNQPMKTEDDLTTEEEIFYTSRFETNFISKLNQYSKPYQATASDE